jgi:hypothetical protein
MVTTAAPATVPSVKHSDPAVVTAAPSIKPTVPLLNPPAHLLDLAAAPGVHFVNLNFYNLRGFV